MIHDIINDSADINLDFEELKVCLKNQGIAYIGSGTDNGSGKAIEAAKDGG